MTSPTAVRSDPPSAAGGVRVGACILVLATVAAYLTSFRGALVFDDIPGIAENPTIRELFRPDLFLEALGPRAGTLAGRPVPNLTLAINYAVSGLDLWSYHVANLLIHVLAGLTLFGVMHRTLLRPGLVERFGSQAVAVAVVVAGLWSLHPLQTESVTYLVQRVESLMGLFYLLTLYCFIRAVDSPHPRRWFVASFTACLLGMGCKEVMVSAPLLVMLYDRTWVAGSWREVWRRRAGFHGALLSTWVVLAGLVMASGGRGGTAGFGLEVSSWTYALTQCKVIIGYLQRALWPHPLVFDHNVRMAGGLGEVWPWALLLLGMLGTSGYLFVRKPAVGFLGAWFFLILAPTSSIVPVADAMVEHRMYLPLAAVIALLVAGLHGRLGRAAIPVWVGVAALWGGLTAFRNLDYSSPLALWTDTVRKVPESARSHNNLGAYFLNEGRLEEAREEFTTALRLDPRYASAHYNLGQLREKTGAMAEAITAYEEAVKFNPRLADARVNLGNLLDRQGRAADAVPHYEAALQLDPLAGDVHANLGSVLLKLRRTAPALEHLKKALEIDPERAETWCALARASQQQNDPAGARRAAERALQLKPDFAEALYVLGNLDAAAGNFAAAIARYRRATELAPTYTAARNNLANALLVSGQVEEAIGRYRELLRERPDDVALRENLARALELQRAGGVRP